MNQHDRDNLQRWLDDDLNAQEHAAFEQRLAESPELRDELERHRQVGRSLQRTFAVPPIPSPLPTAPPRPRWPMFLAGAISAAALLLAWFQPWADHEEWMRTAVGRSWIAACAQPDTTPNGSACASPNQVPQYVQPLTPELQAQLVWRGRPDVQFQRGLEPDPLNGLRVLQLLVLPQTNVFLFVVPESSDPQPILPEDSSWNLFRKSCGALVLYELTPLQTPHGLPCLSQRN